MEELKIQDKVEIRHPLFDGLDKPCAGKHKKSVLESASHTNV